MLTTPVIRCLHKAGHTVDLLTKSKFKEVLTGNPYIRKVLTIDKDLASILPALKAARYDAVVDLHKNIRSFRIRWTLGVPAFDFPKLNMEKWLLVNFKINQLPATHIVDRYFQAVRPLDVRNDGKGLDFFIDAAKNRMTLPEQVKKDHYYLFVVGAAHFTKQIPTEKLIKTALLLEKTVILIGGLSEAAAGAAIAQAAGPNVHNFCGKTTLGQSAWLIRYARAVLTPDTGMMHIAAALKKKVVAVWGNTVPELGMYPYQTPHNNMEIKGLACRPCSKIGKNRCPKRHFGCMERQDVQRWAAALASETA